MEVFYHVSPTIKTAKIIKDVKDILVSKHCDVDIHATKAQTHSYGTVWSIGSKDGDRPNYLLNYFSSAGVPGDLRYELYMNGKYAKRGNYRTIKKALASCL